MEKCGNCGKPTETEGVAYCSQECQDEWESKNLPMVPSYNIGDGATACFWSDRWAGTIIHVSKSGKVVTWQRDKATRNDARGMSDAQSYTYEADPNGVIRKFSLRTRGDKFIFVQVGESIATGCTRLVKGRNEHYDYSF